MNEWMCANVSDWHDGVARHVAQCLRAGIDERGSAALAVSGGRSPVAMFERLRQQDLPWDKVTVTLVDERWVPVSHADSNGALVQRTLLQGKAAAATFVPMFNGAETPQAGRDACEAALRSMRLPLDCAVLGMGEDGHTASLFPQAPELAEACDLSRNALCCATTPMTAPHARMTLTLHTLLRETRQLILPIGGKAKRRVYDQAKLGPSLGLPVSMVLHQDECPIDVWIEE